MTDTVRVLLTAATLVAITMGTLAVRLKQLDANSAARIVGELRLATAAALLLAITAAIYIGLAIASRTIPESSLDVTLSLLFLVASGFALTRDPRESLLVTAAAFTLHALFDIAHRPGLLSAALVPRWYVIACAAINLYMAALCYWARRR